jgi:hypothetical protein
MGNQEGGGPKPKTQKRIMQRRICYVTWYLTWIWGCQKCIWTWSPFGSNGLSFIFTLYLFAFWSNLFWLWGWQQWIWPTSPFSDLGVGNNGLGFVPTLNFFHFRVGNYAFGLYLYFLALGLAKWVWAKLNNTVHSVYTWPAVCTPLYNYLVPACCGTCSYLDHFNLFQYAVQTRAHSKNK